MCLTDEKLFIKKTWPFLAARLWLLTAVTTSSSAAWWTQHWSSDSVYKPTGALQKLLNADSPPLSSQGDLTWNRWLRHVVTSLNWLAATYLFWSSVVHLSPLTFTSAIILYTFHHSDLWPTEQYSTYNCCYIEKWRNSCFLQSFLSLCIGFLPFVSVPSCASCRNDCY